MPHRHRITYHRMVGHSALPLSLLLSDLHEMIILDPPDLSTLTRRTTRPSLSPALRLARHHLLRLKRLLKLLPGRGMTDRRPL
jgi:hypothetical protein